VASSRGLPNPCEQMLKPDMARNLTTAKPIGSAWKTSSSPVEIAAANTVTGTRSLAGLQRTEKGREDKGKSDSAEKARTFEGS
jgi:hypothetical protein